MGRPAMNSEQRVAAFWNKVRKSDSCWEWIGQLNHAGYGMFRKGNKLARAHRISFSMSNQLSDSDIILHSCNNRKCVNPKHLRIGSQKENFHDSILAGTAPICENNGQSKLTKEEVSKIKEMYIPRKFGCVKISRFFNISRRQVSRILSGEAWRFVNYV